VKELPEEIESYRDYRWRRDPELRIEDVSAAEGFIDEVGFCSALTDSRRPGPSLYLAVCGRRDAHTPRNVQKDPEMNLAWTIKDDIIRRGRIYYGKFKGNRSIFIARRLVPYFNAVWGLPRRRESTELSRPAQNVLKVLRKEWEMASRDLRGASGVKERSTFNRAMDELQKVFKIIPSDVVYEPFTYIWSLTETRFQDEMELQPSRDEALKEIARSYLTGAGMTVRGELVRVTGLSRPEAGLGNWGLVDEGFATRVATGVYRLKDFKQTETIEKRFTATF
jgi:hypothetical protein